MASAMRGWGLWNPKAMRVMRRMRVLTDSTRASDRSWSRRREWRRGDVARAGRVRRTRAIGCVGPGAASVPACVCPVRLCGRHQPQTFFEPVGAIQLRAARSDPLQLGALVAGEVLGVLPQRLAGVLHFAGGAGGGIKRHGGSTTAAGAVTGAARFVPHLAAHDIQTAGGPRHNVKRVGAQHRGGRALGHDGADPVPAISRHVGHRLTAVGPRRVEEPVQRRTVTIPCSRHDTRGASPSTNTLTVPRSSPRQRRRPAPWS